MGIDYIFMYVYLLQFQRENKFDNAPFTWKTVRL